jgi:hypothetical protein
MGIFVGSLNGEQVAIHNGRQSGTTTELLLLPKRDIAISAMTNVSAWNGAHALALKIVEIVGK